MQSIEEIYQCYAKTVYHFLLARTGNDDLAEELTQENFTRLYEALTAMMKAVNCRHGCAALRKMYFSPIGESLQ